MGKWIDADALKEWLDEYLSVFKKYDKSEVKGFVEHQPSIDIVRCKECKNNGKDDCPMRWWNDDWMEYEMLNDEEGFCNFGEREE